MPTYQYACTATGCGNEFELVQSFTDPAASACPVCGGPVRKVFSAVGVVFKGSGFYRNDSREAANKAKAGAASGGEASGSSKKESGDAKSADSSASGSSAGSSSSSPSSSSPSSDSPSGSSATPAAKPASPSTGKAAASA